MNAFCPNLSNKEVRANFEQMKSALGENRAYYYWNLNNGLYLDRSPDGDLSDTYSQAMYATNGNEVAALKKSAETLKIMEQEGVTKEDIEESKLFGLKQEDLIFNGNTIDAVIAMVYAMGVHIREVGFDRDDILAAANFMDGTIDIIYTVEERRQAWNKLPEETAHWWYKLLSKDSELKRSLWEAAKKSDKYKELIKKDYGSYSKFENADDLFIEEAIGQLIAEAIHKKQETPKEVESFFEKFWNKVKEILAMFIQSKSTPFEEAAQRILDSDVSELIDIYQLPSMRVNTNKNARVINVENAKFMRRVVNNILKAKKKANNERLKLIEDYRRAYLEQFSNIRKMFNIVDIKEKRLESTFGNVVDTQLQVFGIDTLIKKYKKSGIPLSLPIKLDGVKKLELSIYNRALQLINQYSDEYSGKKTIPVEDFLKILLFVLRDNYNFLFANVDVLNSYTLYRVSDTFVDTHSSHNVNIGMWMNRTQPTSVSAQHFVENPYAFGAIAYFDGESRALIHQIQSDYYDVKENGEKLFDKFEWFYKIPDSIKKQKDFPVYLQTSSKFMPFTLRILFDKYLFKDIDRYGDATYIREIIKEILLERTEIAATIDISKLKGEINKYKFIQARKNYMTLAFSIADYIMLLHDAVDVLLKRGIDRIYAGVKAEGISGDEYSYSTIIQLKDRKTGKYLSLGQVRARLAFKIAGKIKSLDSNIIFNKTTDLNKGYALRSQIEYLKNLLKLSDSQLKYIFQLLELDYSDLSNQSFDILVDLSEYKKLYSEERSKNAPEYEVLLNYAKPLVHHLILTIIQEKGKDFPIYIPGYNLTMNLQGSPNTAKLYATPKDLENNPDLKNVGVMYKLFSELRGVKLEYVDHIPGTLPYTDLHSGNQMSADGYKLDLSEYNFTLPMLFGLKNDNSNTAQEDEHAAAEIDVQNQNDLFQKDANNLLENMDTYVVNRLKEAKRENPDVDAASVILVAKSEFIDRQHKELINKTAEILIKSFDLVRDVDKDGRVKYSRKNQENTEEKADLIIEFLNYLEDDSAGYYDRNSKSTAAHHVIAISLSSGDPSTFSHELAHHYVGMFWKSNLILTALKAIDKPGMTDEEREEELIELITTKTQNEQFLSALENNSFRQKFYSKFAYLLSRTFNINNKFVRNGLITNAARAFMLNQEQLHIDDQNVLFALADSRKHQLSTRKERTARARKLAQKERQEIGYEQIGNYHVSRSISNIVRGSVQRNKAFRRDSQNQPRILTNMLLAEDEVRQFVEDIKRDREEFKKSIGKQNKRLTQSEIDQMASNPKELKRNIKLIRGFISKAKDELLELAEKFKSMQDSKYQNYIYKKVINPATGEYEIVYLDLTEGLNDPEAEIVDITFDELAQTLHNTIGFYESIIKDLNMAVNSQEFGIDYGIDVRDELLSEIEGILNDPELSQAMGLNQILNRVQNLYYHAIESKIKDYTRSVVQEQEGLSDLQKQRLIYSINTWLQDQNVFGDIGAMETWFGLASNSKSPLVRLLQNVIDDIHNKVDLNVLRKGDALLELRKKARKALKRPGWLPINFERFMMERDSDGFTGNFATRVNIGRYETEKDKFINNILFESKNSYQRQVQERIGDNWYLLEFDETGEVIFPQGCDDIEKDYLHKVNRWIGKRAVRQFTTEYYDKRIDMLSSLTRRAQMQYDDKINKIVNAASPNGKFLSELLTKSKRDELKRLYEKKQQLANPYDRYGRLKPIDSDEYIIAKELSEWHKFVKDKVKYKLDRQSFDESLHNATDKDAFIRENTYKIINPEIWEEAKRIYPQDKNIPKLEELIEKRRKLISIVKRRGYNYPNIDEIWDSENKKIRDEYVDFWENLKKLDEEILTIQASLPKEKNAKKAAAYRALLSTIDVMSPYTGTANRKKSWLQHIEQLIIERVEEDYKNDPRKELIKRSEIEKIHAITRVNGQLSKELGLSIFSMTGPAGETVKINGVEVLSIIDEPIQAYSIVDIEKSDPMYVDTRYDISSDIKTQLLCDDTIDQITGNKYHIKKDETDYTNYDFIKNIENGPKEVKDYYEALISTMKESYERIPFVGKYDGRLPQRSASSQQLLWRNALKGQYFKVPDKCLYSRNRLVRGVSSAINFLLIPLRNWAIFNPIRVLKYSILRKWGMPNETDEDINFDYETRPDGTRSMNIPIRYILRLPNPSQINSDIIGGVMSFYQMSLNYKEKSEKLPLFNTVLAKLDSNTSNNTKQRNMVRGMINRQFYDRQKSFDTDDKNLAVYTSDTIRWLLKFIPGLRALTQTGLLALSWTAGIVSYLDPLIQFTVDAVQGKYIDVSDYVVGNVAVVSNILNAVRGLGSSRAYGFVPSGMRYFGLSRPGANNFQRMNRTQLGRFLNLNLLMSPFSLGEYTVKAQTFGAVMHSYRYYKKPGETVGRFYNKKEFIEEMVNSGIMNSKQAAKHFNTRMQFETLYSAYKTDFKSGEFKKANNKYGEAITEEFENRLKKRMKNRATNYNYIVPETERTKIQSNILTAWVTVMRTFMLVGFAERFRSGHDFQIPRELVVDEYKLANIRKELKNEYYADKGLYNFQTGEIENGTFVGFFNVLFRNPGRYLRYLWYNMSHPFQNRYTDDFVEKRELLGISDTDLYGFNRTLTELLVILTLAGCQAVFLNSMDDEDKKDYWMQVINYILIRISIERMTFANPNTLLELINSVSPSKSDIDKKFKLFDLIQDTFVGFRDHGTKFDEWEKVKGLSAYKNKPVAFKDLMQTLSSLGLHNLYTSYSLEGIVNKTKWYKPHAPGKIWWNDGNESKNSSDIEEFDPFKEPEDKSKVWI